jgi:hypothetical protein
MKPHDKARALANDRVWRRLQSHHHKNQKSKIGNYPMIFDFESRIKNQKSE